jgi:hypothetical protein
MRRGERDGPAAHAAAVDLRRSVRGHQLERIVEVGHQHALGAAQPEQLHHVLESLRELAAIGVEQAVVDARSPSAPLLDVTRRLVVEQGEQTAEAGEVAHELEVRASEAGQVRGGHRREARDRHQQEAPVGVALEIHELVDVVGLRNAVVGVERLRKDPRCQHGRVQVQVAPELAALAPEAAAGQEQRRRHRARRADHHARLDRELAVGEPVRVPQDGAHATPPARLDPVRAAVRPDARSSAVRLRDVGHEHAPLRSVGAAEDAEAGAHAARAVVPGDQPVVAEQLGGAPDPSVQVVHLLGEDLLHLEHPLDARVRRLESIEVAHTVRLLPESQDRCGGAEAEAEIVHCRSTHAASLQHADRAVARCAHSGVLEELRDHPVLALVEVLLRVVRALLEHHDVEARRGELGRHHSASRARADHAHVRPLAVRSRLLPAPDDHVRVPIHGPA